MAETAFVALGSNLGDRNAHLSFGRTHISRLPGTRIIAASTVEETAALTLDGTPQPAYLNQMVALVTSLSPFELLEHLQAVEVAAGRVRETRWSARTLDLDIVMFGNCVSTDPRLLLPHPGLAERTFWQNEVQELQKKLLSEDSKVERRVTVHDFLAKKRAGNKLILVSAYDALFGRLAEEGGVDAVLVGDSLGNVILGLDSTVGVTLDQMIHHGAAVGRGLKRSMLIVDMPFLACQTSVERALLNCGRVMQETGAAAVKVEGGDESMGEVVRALVRVGIPVMGHIGFTPQSVHALGGFRVQGKGDAAARVLAEAERLQEAGAFAIVLELMPAALSAQITSALTIPTIGIGAGPHCDGQVLVLADLLGMNDKFSPKFLRKYANLAESVRGAVKQFGDEVASGAYPTDEHSF